MSVERLFRVLVACLALGMCTSVSAVDVVVVVSSRCPVTTLSTNQVADLFLGKTSTFPDGSQAFRSTRPKAQARVTRSMLTFAGRSAAQVKAHWSKIIFTGRGQPPRQAINSAEAKKLIVENPNAIGYIDKSLADGSVKVLLAQ